MPTKLTDFEVKKGERVLLKPEWQDDGDEGYIFIAVSDMERGAVKIRPINTGLAIPPTYVVNRYMISK